MESNHNVCNAVSDEDVHSGNVRDDLRCRWASSLNGECGGVCQVFPGATLSGVC